MRLATLLFILIFGSFSALANESNTVGWHWYNLPKKAQAPQRPRIKMVPLSSLTAHQQVEVLHWVTINAANRATLNPTEANIKAYVQMQKFWMDKASGFSVGWQRMLLDNPNLDYSVKHPHENNTARVESSQISQKEDEAIAQLRKRYGLFFFYRGKNELDQSLASLVERFAKEHHFALIPISVDGKKISTLKGSRFDQGQAKKLGLKAMPALVLVNPKNQATKVVNYGFIAGDELKLRLLDVASNWKRRF